MSSLEHAEAHEALLKCLEEDPARPKLPNLDAFLHPLLEAMDPENCIEEEYHPHNDSVYMWKGLRLLMNRGEMGTFDSACVIRHNAKEGGEKVIEAVLNARGGCGEFCNITHPLAVVLSSIYLLLRQCGHTIEWRTDIISLCIVVVRLPTR